jgi:hypothetical protein
MLKVRELMELLKVVNPDLVVVLQDDPEGKGYRLLSGVDDGDDNLAFVPKNAAHPERGGMEVAHRTLTPALEADGYEKEDMALPEHIPCVVFFP